MNRNRANPLGIFLVLTFASVVLSPTPGEAAAGQPVVYRCDDGTRVIARFPDPYRALLRMGGRNWPLRNTLAASGARYQGKGVTFWLKGEEATLDRPQTRSTNCQVTR